MSIAVSVMVKPSRLLLMMAGGMCMIIVAVAGMIAFGQVGDLSVAMRTSIAVSSFFLAFFGFYHTARNRKTLHIDISGLGQLRLTEVNASIGTCQEQNWPHVQSQGDVVRLLKDSTIWSNLLLLRLQAENGKITVVTVLPDCVSRDSFRALSVACRWLAAHSSPAEHKNL
jgi:toxin CptA